MNNFTKIYRIGTLRIDKNTTCSVFIKAEYKNKELSFMGVEGPIRNGNCIGDCGQINKSYDKTNMIPAKGWTYESIQRLMKIWNNYHLNDMHAECEHQRMNWNLNEEIEIITFTWTTKFYNLMKKASSAEMTTSEYEEYKQIAKKVFSITTDLNGPLYITPDAENLLKNEMVQIKKKEIKQALWIPYKQHPQGLLSKPCEVCGYKYGTTWKHVDVPEEILQELIDFPDTDTQPIWI